MKEQKRSVVWATYLRFSFFLLQGFMNASHGVPPGPAGTPMMNGMHGSHLVSYHVFLFKFYLTNFTKCFFDCYAIFL